MSIMSLLSYLKWNKMKVNWESGLGVKLSRLESTPNSIQISDTFTLTKLFKYVNQLEWSQAKLDLSWKIWLEWLKFPALIGKQGVFEALFVMNQSSHLDLAAWNVQPVLSLICIRSPLMDLWHHPRMHNWEGTATAYTVWVFIQWKLVLKQWIHRDKGKGRLWLNCDCPCNYVRFKEYLLDRPE